MTVELSVPQGKKSATTIIRNTASPSPGVEEAHHAHPRDRTIALMNIPDTVSAARIEKLCEESGALRKVTLRADHGGAIVEFAEEKSVSYATLALDGKELDGEKIIVGTVDELFKRHPKNNRVVEKKKSSFAGGMVPRAAQAAGARRGGRGGLGLKKGLGFTRKSAADSADVDGEASAGGKSNDDFRTMLLKGKQSESKEEQMETDAGD